MVLSEMQEMLLSALHHCGANIEQIEAVMLMLKDSEESMERMLLWIGDNNPELKPMSPEALGELMEEALALSETSTQESEQE